MGTSEGLIGYDAEHFQLSIDNLLTCLITDPDLLTKAINGPAPIFTKNEMANIFQHFRELRQLRALLCSGRRQPIVYDQNFIFLLSVLLLRISEFTCRLAVSTRRVVLFSSSTLNEPMFLERFCWPEAHQFASPPGGAHAHWMSRARSPILGAK